MKRTFAQKLGVKTQMQIHLHAVPPDYLEKAQLSNNKDYTISLESKFDFIHVFSKEESELITSLENIIPHLQKDGILWISWPKKSSKIITTLDKWKVMQIGQAAGLVDVKVLSYNLDWSSLKFVYRLKDR